MNRPVEDLAERIAAALADFDGKATTIPSEAARRYENHAVYLEALLHLSATGDEPRCGGATWMLKDWLEKGGEVPANLHAQISRLGPELTGWASQLHFCQSIRHIPFDHTQALQLADWLNGLTDAERPFLRAWSIDALVSLAPAGEKVRAMAAKRLVTAVDDPAASVRARARNLRLPPSV